jgi:hypothetical protein
MYVKQTLCRLHLFWWLESSMHVALQVFSGHRVREYCAADIRLFHLWL